MYDTAMIVVDNFMWCASGDKIRVIDTTTGKIVNLVETKNTSRIRCITDVGDHHQVWAGSHDKRVYVYDYESKAFIQLLKSHNASIRCIQKVGDTVWSGSTDGCVCIWDTSTPIKHIKQIQCHTRGVNALCLSGNYVWSGSDDKCLRVTDAQTFKYVKKLQGHMDYINTLATVGNKVWCGSEDKSVSIWDAKVGLVTFFELTN
jgi:WD40 repeat protein